MEKVKNPVHALLAVESDIKNVSIKIINETSNTFSKKNVHFDGINKQYVSEDDSAVGTNNTEIKEVVTTVAKKVKYAIPAIVAGIDIQLSKEMTNSSGTASATLTDEGHGDFGILSATALLSLEKEMVKIRNMYESIPTLDPGKTWVRDDFAGKDMWKTDDSITFRTGKKEEWVIVAPATKEHPAQVKQVTKDGQVGKYLTHYTSGTITPLSP